MKRRDFIKSTGMATLGAATFPYLLPQGRLFAPTGKRIANHVVFCLFAGGIRNFESIQKAEGNLMPYTLKGKENIATDILPGLDYVPQLNATPLQQFGTLYKKFKYNSSATLHYTAHASAIMGVYDSLVQIMQPLSYPSIFEYYRKHNSPQQSALNAWWVTDQAGPFTYLNYSNYPGYGPLYGANMIQPTAFVNKTWGMLTNYARQEMDMVDELKMLLNKNTTLGGTLAQVTNTAEDKNKIDLFIQQLSKNAFADNFNIWETGKSANEDIFTMYTAAEILKEFKPELLLVNMQHSDIGHNNFTNYCSDMRKADYALYNLWQTIQSIPQMKDDTILIVAPEFGRNLQPNTIVDAYGRYAIDHNGDETSKQIFCLIAGPPNLVKQDVEITDETGETIDIVPTIARILGFDTNMPKNLLNGRFLQEAFV